MRVSQMLKKWAKITGQHGTTNRVAPNVTAEDLQQWVIRECDRKDYRDWMPFRISNSDDIKVYYVNINAESTAYNHSLVLTAKGTVFRIDEWDRDRLVSATSAVVESNPAVPKPSDDEISLFQTLS